MQFFALARMVDLHTQSTAVRRKTQEPGVVAESSARRLGFLRQRANQPGALDNEVGAVQRDLGRAPVGEEFKSPDFIDNAGTGRGTDLASKVVGDNQGAWDRIEGGTGFQYVYFAPATRNLRSRKEPRSGATHDNNFFAIPAGPVSVPCFIHFTRSIWNFWKSYPPPLAESTSPERDNLG
jgi:hypothetical protein